MKRIEKPPADEPRTWATRDRARAEPPSRRLARQMRAAPTDAEAKLWWHLRHRLKVPNTHFRRQVRMGRYIVDFASHRAKLVIEVDGGQHALTAEADADALRTNFLEAEGYRVLRFWNNDVLGNIDGVLDEIGRALATATPTPDPSPQGGGEKPARFPRPIPPARKDEERA